VEATTMDNALTAAGPAGAGSVAFEVPAADSAAAAAHFAGRLAFETDVSDVHDDLAAGRLGTDYVLVDVRSEQAWDLGHVPGAVHLPTRRIAARAAEGAPAGPVPPGVPVVVYCWSPGCNGATKAALEFARLGHPVKEMIGGFEYWVREGFAYATRHGLREPAADPLTIPVVSANTVSADTVLAETVLASTVSANAASCGC
jgi:rhodanese-related sulfurtransferase